MRAAPMVVGQIRAKDPTEMRLVEHDHLIETFATDGPNHVLDVGILPGTSWIRYHLGEAETRDPSAHLLVVDAVAIA